MRPEVYVCSRLLWYKWRIFSLLVDVKEPVVIPLPAFRTNDRAFVTYPQWQTNVSSAFLQYSVQLDLEPGYWPSYRAHDIGFRHILGLSSRFVWAGLVKVNTTCFCNIQAVRLLSWGVKDMAIWIPWLEFYQLRNQYQVGTAQLSQRWGHAAVLVECTFASRFAFEFACWRWSCTMDEHFGRGPRIICRSVSTVPDWLLTSTLNLNAEQILRRMGHPQQHSHCVSL